MCSIWGGGKSRVKGTWVFVALLLECLATGMTIPQIVDTYPFLTEPALKRVMEELAREKEKAAV